MIGGNINIIDSATAIAHEVKKLLLERNIENDSSGGNYVFYVSDCPEKFKKLGSNFFGKKIKNVKKVEIDKQ